MLVGLVELRGRQPIVDSSSGVDDNFDGEVEILESVVGCVSSRHHRFFRFGICVS